MTSTTTPHYEKGSISDVAIVLSCPGRDELKANKPAAGQTGRNLEAILSLLRKNHSISGFERGDITITNAWDQVEFDGEGGTDRSEADILEIMKPFNLDRLADEIKEIKKFIVCCGINAKVAVAALKYANKLKSCCRVLDICHLGNQAINVSIRNTLSGDEIRSYSKLEDKPSDDSRTLQKIREDNRMLRLEVIASRLARQIQNK